MILAHGQHRKCQGPIPGDSFPIPRRCLSCINPSISCRTAAFGVAGVYQAILFGTRWQSVLRWTPGSMIKQDPTGHLGRGISGLCRHAAYRLGESVDRAKTGRFSNIFLKLVTG